MNYVFDDVTHQFNGITSSYTLKQNELNTTGFSTDNGIILVNNIFQVPEGAQLVMDHINWKSPLV